jgi:3-dehydroquinate dehydratase type I
VKSFPPAVATRLVVSLRATSEDELVRMALASSARADVVELRIDGIDHPNLERLRALGRDLGKPVLLTCRSAREGGAFSGTEKQQLSILERAVALGFEYVDVEIDALAVPFPRGSGTRLVLSHHDFRTLPADVDAKIARALELGADIVKIAARVSSLEGTLRLARADSEAGRRTLRLSGLRSASGASRPRPGACTLVAASRSTGPRQIPLMAPNLYRFRASRKTGSMESWASALSRSHPRCTIASSASREAP